MANKGTEFKTGRKKTGGRKKGSENKATGEIKDMIRQALDECGGVEYLKIQAADNPVAFLSLIKAILPKDVTVSGKENGEPVEIRIVGWNP